MTSASWTVMQPRGTPENADRIVARMASASSAMITLRRRHRRRRHCLCHHTVSGLLFFADVQVVRLKGSMLVKTSELGVCSTMDQRSGALGTWPQPPLGLTPGLARGAWRQLLDRGVTVRDSVAPRRTRP
jgi:hypothetical protein